MRHDKTLLRAWRGDLLGILCRVHFRSCTVQRGYEWCGLALINIRQSNQVWERTAPPPPSLFPLSLERRRMYPVLSLTLNHQARSCSSPAPSFMVIPLHLKSRAPLPASSHAAKQPVCQPHELSTHTIFPLPMALHMLNGVAQDPSLAVKLKDEQAREALLACALLAGLKALAEWQPPSYAGAAGGLPAHSELLGARPCPLAMLLDHALRQDLELHVADDGKAVPGDGRGPERGNVGDASRNGGEVRVGRGEEVQADIGSEDLLREGRLKEGGEALLEDTQSWEGMPLALIFRFGMIRRERRQLAHFCPASLCARLVACRDPGPAAARHGRTGRSD